MVVAPLDTAAVDAFHWRSTSAGARNDAAEVMLCGAAEVRIPGAFREILHAFAVASQPFECCGIGIGPAGEVREFHPVPNVHGTPKTRYEIASTDQLRVFRRADDLGWDITLVFHSHPATQAFPSSTDVDLAGWPDAVYLIQGFPNDTPSLRAFHITNRQIAEVSISRA